MIINIEIESREIVNQLAAAMERIMSDETLRMELAQKALERSKAFSWEHCGEEHWKVMREVV